VFQLFAGSSFMSEIKSFIISIHWTHDLTVQHSMVCLHHPFPTGDKPCHSSAPSPPVRRRLLATLRRRRRRAGLSDQARHADGSLPGGRPVGQHRAPRQRAAGAALGQPVIVENLGGASGSIAAQKVLNAPMDGYLVFQGSPNELILAPLAISVDQVQAGRLPPGAPHRGGADGRFLPAPTCPVKNADELAAYAAKVPRKASR
jgi:hypothetical protein